MSDKRSRMADVMAAIRQSIETGPAAEAGGRPVRVSDAMVDMEGHDDSGSEAGSSSARTAAYGDIPGIGTSTGGCTVEKLVADLLEPMLKDWLDQNLPDIVERIVREEVQRVTRR